MYLNEKLIKISSDYTSVCSCNQSTPDKSLEDSVWGWDFTMVGKRIFQMKNINILFTEKKEEETVSGKLETVTVVFRWQERSWDV